MLLLLLLRLLLLVRRVANRATIDTDLRQLLLIELFSFFRLQETVSHDIVFHHKRNAVACVEMK